MKHLHGVEGAISETRSETSISASHESEEQLSELIRDYEGHGCKSAVNLENAVQTKQ